MFIRCCWSCLIFWLVNKFSWAVLGQVFIVFYIWRNSINSFFNKDIAISSPCICIFLFLFSFLASYKREFLLIVRSSLIYTGCPSAELSLVLAWNTFLQELSLLNFTMISLILFSVFFPTLYDRLISSGDFVYLCVEVTSSLSYQKWR